MQARYLCFETKLSNRIMCACVYVLPQATMEFSLRCCRAGLPSRPCAASSPLHHVTKKNICVHTLLQATTEFFPALLQSKPAFKALRSQQPEVFTGMLDCCLTGMALAATEAWAVNLETLYLVRRIVCCV
jgi:hypothetical protein